MNERMISKPAVFRPSWFSYQGAVQGALGSLGVEVGLDEIIAITGYGWITNAMKKHLCPSAPSAYHQDVWMGNYRATENLGYRVEVILSGSFEWDGNQRPTQESLVNAKKQYDAVVREIDKDRPVVMWGLPIPEYGIVNGYKGEEYVVSTFRRLINQPDTAVHYTGLRAPGGLMSMRFVEPKTVDQREVAVETLRRGYRLGTGDAPQLQGYVLGPEAYEVLANNFTEEAFDENSYHGAAYTLACLMEAKWGVSEYLRKVDPLLDAELVPVSEKYGELNRVLKKCHDVFPMGSGEMLRESCVKVAGWMRESKRLEVEALEGIKQALEAL